MSAALDYTYRYLDGSSLAATPTGPALRLATCGLGGDDADAHPHFFDGRIRHPRGVADMLLVLADVVRTHFFLNRPPMLDPVVTGNEAMLRFEGFSGCCGVYARADLPASMFHSDITGRGTTNVDFNPPMRAALTRLRDRDDARLAVGHDALTLQTGEHKVIEKKVKLPVRWIKAFCEVQAYQSRLEPVDEVPAADARRLLRSLPATGGPKRPSFLTRTGRSLRLSQRASKGSVQVHGLHRLRPLEPLMTAARSLRILYDDTSGTSGWEANFSDGRFLLLLSPETYRGFSGEGQVLSTLAAADYQEALPHVRAQLTWQNAIAPDRVAHRAGLTLPQVEAALAALGTRGLAGYDAHTRQYFHRQLPFDLDAIEKLQPRLLNARKLIDADAVTLVKQLREDAADYRVQGTGVTHYVQLRPPPDGESCTCPWFSKHRGQRGPCKHILAAQLRAEDLTG